MGFWRLAGTAALVMSAAALGVILTAPDRPSATIRPAVVGLGADALPSETEIGTFVLAGLSGSSAGILKTGSEPLFDLAFLVDVPAASRPARAGRSAGATPERIAYIEERMLNIIPDDIEGYFDLFMYVSRASEGPYGQRLYVFERNRDTGELQPFAQWLISTGREQQEKHWTGTPDGIFKLDPSRFYSFRMSNQWGTPMPSTMFFDAEFARQATGYAIHGASRPEDVAALGMRASAGCIRLHPEHAEMLFRKIQKEMRGRVPVFAYDEETDSTALDGQAMYNARGDMVTRKGYRVLLLIENFEGGPEAPSGVDAVASLM
ncbi:MAG: L,D-transpeptidase family protein [Alphaproteobacteria bacterium]|nr:L,D-transpeptidase family protein [Alphaproteobacteria bacterium]